MVVNDGVTVDLGLMNVTTYDGKTGTASVQPGSRWRDVYETLDPLEMTVPGDRAAGVGVAGFLTGGGFACDNIVNFEVVLASAEIVNANAAENSDLFLVLKGGQSNFGIVTRFDMQAFETPPLWGGVVMYPKTTTVQAIDACVAWTDNVQNYPDGSAIVFWTYQPAIQDTIIVAAYHDISGTVAAPAYDKLLAIPGNLSSHLRTASHLDLTVELEQPEGYHDIWWTVTFKNDRQVYEKIIELHDELCASLAAQSPDGDFITQVMFQAIPKILTQRSAERGGNVLGLDREDGTVVMLLLTLAVNGEEQEAVGVAKMRAYVEAIVEYSRSPGAEQDPLGSYGAANLAKIHAAARKYDPKGVFQMRSPGGFKVTRSPAFPVSLQGEDNTKDEL
ncbi:hypothetical protein BX600DRAFT_484441 [Xylariales sp. PMI_506]|nr:hypothetical protein BX600DRAFT_484441 [Xylariales sp. PMI_506]